MRNWHRKVWCLGLLAFLGLNASKSEAVIIVSIDAIPGNTPGTIDATRSVPLGQNFSVDVLITLTGTASLKTYGVSVQYDTAPLNLNPTGDKSAATEFLPIADILGVDLATLGGRFQLNLSSGVGGATESAGGGKGLVSTFEAGTFGSGPTTPNPANQSSVTFRAGSINFTAASLGSATVLPGLFGLPTGSDGLFDNVGNAVVGPQFSSASITVTPEPSSLMLMTVATTIALCGYGLRRRRKQRQTA